MYTNTYKSPIHPFLLVTCLCAISATVLAGPVTVPNSFSSGTPAVASQVNANFAAVKTSVDDNDSRIAALEASIATLQANLTAANDTIATLQNDLNAVENNSVLALDGILISTTDSNGYATAQFTGVNVQVINGATQTTVNGLGNLIVGYNDARSFGLLICSDGQYANQLACEGAGEIWTRSHKSGSHNLVTGNQNSYSQTGGIVSGYRNATTRNYATISGGSFNIASGFYSNVSGGLSNRAIGDNSSVSGGSINNASGTFSSINGGQSNIASGDGSSVNGGQVNEATGTYSSVNGGRSNEASSDNSTVNGGQANQASGPYSTVSGGFSRDATGIRDWVAGSLFEDQ